MGYIHAWIYPIVILIRVTDLINHLTLNHESDLFEKELLEAMVGVDYEVAMGCNVADGAT